MKELLFSMQRVSVNLEVQIMHLKDGLIKT
jgi:hypothetical protein